MRHSRTSSVKPGLHRFLRTAVAFFAVFSLALLPALPALADTPCPANGTEQGGTRTCFNTSNGHVYVWKPANYDASKAITVIHVHGYSKYDEDGTSNHYVDEAWKNHALARKFSKSGLNAMFIVPEAWTDNYTGNMWTSMTSLLATVVSHNELPPQSVGVESHSGGIFTIMHWLGEPRLQSIILLDSVYGNAPDSISSWTKTSGAHKLTVINSSSPNAGTEKLLAKIPAADLSRHTGMPSAFDQLSEAERKAHVLFLDVQSSFSHMALVQNDGVIPVALGRMGATALGAAGAGAAAGGGLVPEPLPFVPIVPKLSIPIPGLSFSQITMRDTGQKRIIDIPYLAEYLAAVYKYGVGIASIIASIMMMIGGFRWLTAGGDTGRVTKAKEMISNALVGLGLSLGAYVILYTVNPDLVTLKGMQVNIISRVKFTAEESFDTGDVADSSDAGTPAGGGPGCISGVTVCKTEQSCIDYCNNTPKAQWPKCNSKTINPSSTKLIPESTGLHNANSQSATQAMIDGLKRAGEIADAKGYVINVMSGFRPLDRQIGIVCDKVKAKETTTLGQSVAWPGGSNHGSGVAADLQMADKNTGKMLVISGAYAAQNDKKYEEPSKVFAEIMNQAGFIRYSKEIWHFELPNNSSCRCKGRACPFPPSC